MSEINEQLLFMNESDKTYCIGDDIEGSIISKSNEGIIISIIGYKYEGLIPLNELTSNEEPQVLFDKLNIGDTLKGKIIKLNNGVDNNIILSRLEYDKEEAIKEIDDAFSKNIPLDLYIKEAKENGLISYYKGVRIFIPVSQIDVKFVSNPKDFIGKTLSSRIIDFNISNPSRVVASHRVIQEENLSKIEEQSWEKLNIGDVVKAEIKRFTKFGAFAEVFGIDGLIHLSQISWNHVKRAEDHLKSGDVIDVKIIDMNKELKKLSLSIKELTPEPWENVSIKYPVDSIVLGKVVRISDFGAFIELEPGVDGLVHISKISHDRVNNPSDILSIGEEIKAKILSVDEENKRISLSIKDV